MTRRPMPRVPNPGRAESGHRPCNEPLEATDDRGVLGYCCVLVKPGKRHRGPHRIEWHT